VIEVRHDDAFSLRSMFIEARDFEAGRAESLASRVSAVQSLPGHHLHKVYSKYVYPLQQLYPLRCIDGTLVGDGQTQIVSANSGERGY
jgi:hypothetical protein